MLKASRGLAGKSFAMAAVATCRAVTMDQRVNIMGGSQDQSKNVQQYIKGIHENVRGFWWEWRFAPKWLLAPSSDTEQRFTNKGAVKALSHSQTHARGGHPKLLMLDEADEMQKTVVDAALGQAQSALTETANTVIGSTHHNVDGTMTWLLEELAIENEWPIMEWCYLENHVDNGGWLDDEAIERKKKTMSAERWRVEVEMQEPAPENRTFTEEQLELIFDKAWGEMMVDIPDVEGFEYRFIQPAYGGDFVTGADWGRTHYTCIHTFRESDSGPDQLAAWNYLRLGDWPAKINLYNERMRDYGGKGKHDQTGIGDVIQGFIDPGVNSVGFFFNNVTERAEIFNLYVMAGMDGDYTLPMIPRLFKVMSRLTNDHVYYGKHPPDEFVAGALAFSLTKKAKYRRRKRRRKKVRMERVG